ncbi:MAG: class I SAM-dependent methyltransferase [Thermodesulfobacteriota bacterium]
MAAADTTCSCPCCGSEKLRPEPLSMEGFFACAGCGLIFASPERRECFVQKLSGHYGQEDPHRDVARSKQAFFSRALDRLGMLGAGARLLDVGCGYGYFLEMAAGRGFVPFGVDIVEQAVAAAREKPGVAGAFCGDLAEAGFMPESFDAVTLWDVLMVSPDPARLLACVKELLRPGGVLAVRDRNAAFQTALCRAYRVFRVPAGLLGVKNPSVFHPFTFTAASLRSLLGGAGFVEVVAENSPLTRSDPYSVSRLPGLADAAKAAANLFARATYALSGGRRVAGPSLLCWARKP